MSLTYDTLSPEMKKKIEKALNNPDSITAEKCKRSLFFFMKTFWHEISSEVPHWNWHIEYLCNELQEVAERVAKGQPAEYDLIINIPPGTTKSTTCTIMFPVWCWTKWPWMKFIAASYSGALSLEHAEASRDLVRSATFKRLYPDVEIKPDKDTKTNFRMIQKLPDGTTRLGGNRLSTSVGGTVTGFHGHILLVDDPIDPNRAVSALELDTASRWMTQTLSTRKVDKAVTPTVLIMQRLHEIDPTGALLDKKDKAIRHICLPGEIRNFGKFLKPPSLADFYVDELLDPRRMPWSVLEKMETDLGQYGYASQVGQNPVPAGGGMFKVDHLIPTESVHPTHILRTIRYWDKAGTEGGKGARTAGSKMCMLRNGKFVVLDVRSGRWATDEREAIIRHVAEADGPGVEVWVEQEPGSGGKESAQATIRNLAGFRVYADRPQGDKIYRADPYSVQVNNGNILLLKGDWNASFIEEHRFFPMGKLKDMVDATSGAFSQLASRKVARVLD